MPDPLSSNMSPEECKTACLEDDACEGVVTSSGRERGYCYKRRGLSLGNCVRDSDWTLHEKRAGMNIMVIGIPPVLQYFYPTL